MNLSTLRTWARVLCITHALLVTGLWYIAIILDKNIVKTSILTGLAWVWPLWAMSLALSPKAYRFGWFASIGASLLILSPTFSTFYTFAVWSIYGFAP